MPICHVTCAKWEMGRRPIWFKAQSRSRLRYPRFLSIDLDQTLNPLRLRQPRLFESVPKANEVNSISLSRLSPSFFPSPASPFVGLDIWRRRASRLLKVINVWFELVTSIAEIKFWFLFVRSKRWLTGASKEWLFLGTDHTIVMSKVLCKRNLA